MSSETEHLWALLSANRRGVLTPFTPLTPEEFEILTGREDLQQMDRDLLDRIWLKPVQRMLQWHYGIDQRGYSAGTTPSLTELEEDFRVAAAITVDRLAANPDEVRGRAGVEGANQSWDQQIPMRASMLLERYKRPGGRITRG